MPAKVNVVFVSGAITALEVVIVGLAIVEIVVEPPNATLEPLIVILEFCNWAFVTLVFGNVTVLEAKLSVLCNWAAATVPSIGVPTETV